MADIRKLRYGCAGDYFGPGSVAATTLDAVGKKVAAVFRASEAAVITTVLVSVGTKTGTGGGYKVSLQGVDAATGMPDGADLGGVGAPTLSAEFTPTASTTISRVALTNAYTVARGDLIAIVIECTATSGGNYSSLNHSSGFASSAPYGATYDGAAWAKTAFTPATGFASASHVYGCPVLNDTYTACGANEIGLSFTIPATLCRSYKVGAVVLAMRCVTAGSAITVTLYDTDGTSALQAVTYDTDALGSVAVQYAHRFQFDEATLATLNAGSTYYIGVKRGAADSADLRLYWFSVDAVDALEPFGGGSDFAWWLKGTGVTTTQRAMAELVLEDWTPAAMGATILQATTFEMVEE